MHTEEELGLKGQMLFVFKFFLLFLFGNFKTSLALSVPPLQTETSLASSNQCSSFDSVLDQRGPQPLHLSANNYHDHGDKKSNGENTVIDSRQRRQLVRGLTGVVGATFIGPSIASAGEVGARITKAVTTSDLGISVRTSVVKGAQLADKIDGKWEKFSDKYGLGSERSKQVARRPNDKQIPDPLPLNIDVAQKILDVSDEVFLKLVPSVSPQKLTASIEKVAKLSMPSFERSGVSFFANGDGTGNNSRYDNVAASDLLRFQTAPQFNFVVYAHFKAYSDLILERGDSINFSTFRVEYERGVGQRLIEILELAEGTYSELAKEEQQPSSVLKNQILVALKQTDALSRRLRELGLVANIDRNSVESSDDLEDFVDDALPDLVITVSVDGDATLQSQMLLQEQGFRLYPNFNRFIVAEFFRKAMTSPSLSRSISGKDDGSHKVSVIDYYFDTDYTSNPDLFEVKQVLLNISIE